MISSQHAAALDSRFWERLSHLEDQHRRVRELHKDARRALEGSSTARPAERLSAWRHYCEVIDELDRTTAQLEELRACGA
jgi:hypothetical protein